MIYQLQYNLFKQQSYEVIVYDDDLDYLYYRKNNFAFVIVVIIIVIIIIIIIIIIIGNITFSTCH